MSKFDDLNRRLIELKQKWVISTNININEMATEFDLDVDYTNNRISHSGTNVGKNNLDAINISYSKNISEVVSLLMEFEQYELMTERTRSELQRIAHIIQHTKNTLINFHFRNEQVQNNTFLALADETAQKNRLSIIRQLNIMNNDIFSNDVKPSNFQKTLRKVLDWCMKEELRVSGDTLYEPKRVRGAKLIFQDGEKICHICGKKESEHTDASVRGNLTR